MINDFYMILAFRGITSGFTRGFYSFLPSRRTAFVLLHCLSYVGSTRCTAITKDHSVNMATAILLVLDVYRMRG